MRTYDTYKDSGISWLGQIPSHWELKPGFSLYHENDEKFDMLSEPTVLSLSYGNIIVKKNKDEGLVPENYSGYQVIKPDYIIIRCTDLQNDKVSLRTGIAKNHGIITGAYLGLIAKDGFNAQYLHYFLHDWDITKEIYRHGSGLRQVLSWNDMKRLPILVPPLAEQKAIVAYLDNATAEIDKAIASQQRMVELLQERKQIIINQAVTQGLNPDAPMKPTNIDWLPQIPAHWEYYPLKYSLSLKARVGWKGLTSDEFLTEGYAYLVTGQDFIKADIEWSNCYQIDKKRYEEDPYIQLSNGDLLVTKDGTIGKVAIVSGLDKPACLNSGIFVVKQKKSSFIPEYLYWQLLSCHFTEFFSYNSTGSTIKHLYQNVFDNMPMLIPPLNEQRKIVQHIDIQTKPIDNAIEKCRSMIDLLTERKQILINDVVTGKIKV